MSVKQAAITAVSTAGAASAYLLVNQQQPPQFYGKIWKRLTNKNCPSEIIPPLCMWAVRACVEARREQKSVCSRAGPSEVSTQPPTINLQYFIAWEVGWHLDKAYAFLGHLAEDCCALYLKVSAENSWQPKKSVSSATNSLIFPFFSADSLYIFSILHIQWTHTASWISCTTCSATALK